MNYRAYNLRGSSLLPTGSEEDCPKFTERRDWAENANRSGEPAPGVYVPTGPEQGVVTTFAVPVSDSWTMPDNSAATGTRAEVTVADGTADKVTSKISVLGPPVGVADYPPWSKRTTVAARCNEK